MEEVSLNATPYNLVFSYVNCLSI